MKTAALTALLLSSTAFADVSVPAPEARVASCYAPSALSRAIRCRGNTCRVDRAAIDCWLEHTDEMARSARIVPALHDGAATGFKLYAMRPGSLFQHLQMQNGDELRTINGMDLTSPEKALEVYSRLRAASQIVVEIVRNGQRSTLEYKIR